MKSNKLYDSSNNLDPLEQIYSAVSRLFLHTEEYVRTRIRRLIRLAALPYCLTKQVDWKICPVPPYKVVLDLLYIAFRLKYYPDNYSLCKLWKVDRSSWKYYYGSIYDPFQRWKLRKEVQKKEYQILFEDKNICYQLCKAANLPLPVQYTCLNPSEDYISAITNIFNHGAKKIIIKYVEGMGGKGIAIAYKDGDDIYVNNRSCIIPLNNFILNKPAVVQEFLTQHESLNNFSKSVNTIRIVSLLTKENSVVFLGAYLRFGINDSFLDNLSSGGIGVSIDINKGTLRRVAYGFGCSEFDKHPTSGLPFEGFEIPHWERILALVKDTQKNFYFYKLLGHDIAVSDNGPVIIELNSAPDVAALEMLCGPLLKNPEILHHFNQYDLLINKPSKQIILNNNHTV